MVEYPPMVLLGPTKTSSWMTALGKTMAPLLIVAEEAILASVETIPPWLPSGLIQCRAFAIKSSENLYSNVLFIGGIVF